MAITQEDIKKILHYDSNTGIFTWLKRDGRNGGVKVGSVAGYAHKGKKGKSYVKIRINTFSWFAHRLAWIYVYGSIQNEIDHINGNGCDNRIENLRNVTRLENCRNLRKQCNNTSGVTGVTWDKRYDKWQSKIQIEGINKSLGYFDNLFDAACARKNAEVKYGFHKNHGIDRPL